MSQRLDNSEEAKKLLILKVGVLIFAIALISFWSLNLGSAFSARSVRNEQSSAWQEDLNKTIGAITSSTTAVAGSAEEKAFLAEMVNNLTDREIATTSTAVATVTVATPHETATLTPEQLIKNLEQRLPTVIASSSCPEFIDCMPSVGEAKPCVIPAGCENITQIAY